MGYNMMKGNIYTARAKLAPKMSATRSLHSNTPKHMAHIMQATISLAAEKYLLSFFSPYQRKARGTQYRVKQDCTTPSTLTIL